MQYKNGIIMNLKYNIIIILLVIVTFPCIAAVPAAARNALDTGQAFYDNEQYSEATSLYLEAMKTAKEHDDMVIYTEGLYNLGMVYVRMDDMERALYYFNLCLEKARSIGDRIMQGKCVSYMSCCYGFMNNLKMAKYYFEMQRTLPHENENMKQYFMLYNGGLTSFLEGKQDAALRQFHLAIDCVQRHRLDKKYLQSVYGMMVYIQLYKKNIDEALRYCDEYKRATEGNSKRLWKEAYYEMLCDVYKAAGDTVKSKMYRHMADSTFNARIAKQQIKDIDNRIVKFEGKNNRDDIMALNTTVNKQWQFIAVCIVFVVILVALVMVIVIKNRRLKHAYKLVIGKNRELVVASQMSQKLRNQKDVTASSDAISSNASNDSAIDGSEDNESKFAESSSNEISLKQEQIDDILAKVTSVMEKVDIISKSDFTLVALAQMIGSNTRYVSWVINNTYKKNFKTLLNEYRIREVCRRMEDTDKFGNLTIQALYVSLGYSSASNFLRAFKNVNGMTPSTYMKLITEKKGKK